MNEIIWDTDYKKYNKIDIYFFLNRKLNLNYIILYYNIFELKIKTSKA